MSTRHRVERAALATTATALAVVFAYLLVASASTTARESWLVGGLWGSGLSALLCAFAACRFDVDTTDDPEYLASVVRGLRAEWQRHRTS